MAARNESATDEVSFALQALPASGDGRAPASDISELVRDQAGGQAPGGLPAAALRQLPPELLVGPLCAALDNALPWVCSAQASEAYLLQPARLGRRCLTLGYLACAFRTPRGFAIREEAAKYSLAYELVARLTHVPTQTAVPLPYSLLVSGASGLYECLSRAPERPEEAAEAAEAINEAWELVCPPRPGGAPPAPGSRPVAGAGDTPAVRPSPAVELISTLLFKVPSKRFGRPEDLAQFALQLCSPLPLYGEYSLELEFRGVLLASSRFLVGFCFSNPRPEPQAGSEQGSPQPWSRRGYFRAEAASVPRTVELEDWICLQPLGSHRARQAGSARAPQSPGASPGPVPARAAETDWSSQSGNKEISWSDSSEAGPSFSSLSRSPSPTDGRKARRVPPRRDGQAPPRSRKPLAPPPPRASSRSEKHATPKGPAQARKQLRKLFLGLLRPEAPEKAPPSIEDTLTAVASREAPRADKDHACVGNESERRFRPLPPGVEPAFRGGVESIVSGEAAILTLRVSGGECLIYLRYRDSDTSDSVQATVIAGSKVLASKVELVCTERAVDVYMDGECGRTLPVAEPEYSFGFTLLDRGCCIEIIDDHNSWF